jgi:hypothetical protein
MELFNPNIFNDLQVADNVYEPPRIEILEIAVEKGFADSTSDFIPGTW